MKADVEQFALIVDSLDSSGALNGDYRSVLHRRFAF